MASFLLQLSLLDLSCCGYAPSQLAAAALSLSMTAFNKPAWPRVLETYGSYTLAGLEPLRYKLAAIQEDLTASQLRRCWKMTYTSQDVEHSDAWKQAMAVFDCPSDTLLGLLGKRAAVESAVDLPKALELPVPSAINITQIEEDEILIEADDDTSSASTNSALDGDLLLASAPMSPQVESDEEGDGEYPILVLPREPPQTFPGLVATW